MLIKTPLLHQSFGSCVCLSLPLFLFISLFLADSLERKSRLRNPGNISLFPSLTFSSLTLDHQVLTYYRTNKGRPSAPVLNTLFHASNLDRRSISHMVIYTFQCYSLKSSHPRVLPQSPKVCSLHLCLFCCLAYGVIVTIFLKFHIHVLIYHIGIFLSDLLHSV